MPKMRESCSFIWKGNVMRKLIIAICGESCSGKDTLAKKLVELLRDYDSSYVVSDTTRPARINEIDGIDYNFLSQEDFINKKHIEFTKFRGWYYGLPIDSLLEHRVNIVVLNPKGVENLVEWLELNKLNYVDLCIIRTSAPTIERLKRAVKRESKFKLEYLRRMIADYFDFRNCNKMLASMNNRAYIEHITTSSDESNFIAQQIVWNFLGQL
jgi:guanylate kinase